MQDAQILSTPKAAPSAAPLPARVPVRVFDACHVGVVLRAVLAVEAVLGVAALFVVSDMAAWLLRLALLTSAALPATLVWLIATCALKNHLARWPDSAAYTLAVALGALAGCYAAALLLWSGLFSTVPWLACASAGALLSGALVTALVWRARGQTPAATAARLHELQARIRPHFLFNTLNSAIALVRAEPARAEAVLEDLSELFRQALTEPDQSVTLAQEVALAERYLAIEKVRFAERLRLHWSIDPTAADARLPPLLLQPLVENAVKHGVEPSADGADVRVSTRRRGASVVIKVSNSLPPQHTSSTAGSGIALANVRDRLRLLHDLQCRFRAGIRDGWYQVRIEVPAP